MWTAQEEAQANLTEQASAAPPPQVRNITAPHITSDTDRHKVLHVQIRLAIKYVCL